MKPKRIQLKCTKGWHMPKTAVYVGTSAGPQDGIQGFLCNGKSQQNMKADLSTKDIIRILKGSSVFTILMF
jgi:hypothetical protein